MHFDISRRSYLWPRELLVTVLFQLLPRWALLLPRASRASIACTGTTKRLFVYNVSVITDTVLCRWKLAMLFRTCVNSWSTPPSVLQSRSSQWEPSNTLNTRADDEPYRNAPCNASSKWRQTHVQATPAHAVKQNDLNKFVLFIFSVTRLSL